MFPACWKHIARRLFSPSHMRGLRSLYRRWRRALFCKSAGQNRFRGRTVGFSARGLRLKSARKERVPLRKRRNVHASSPQEQFDWRVISYALWFHPLRSERCVLRNYFSDKEFVKSFNRKEVRRGARKMGIFAGLKRAARAIS